MHLHIGQYELRIIIAGLAGNTLSDLGLKLMACAALSILEPIEVDQGRDSVRVVILV